MNRIYLALARAFEAVERVGSRAACKMFGLSTSADVINAISDAHLAGARAGRNAAGDAYRAKIASLQDRTNTLAEQLRLANATLDQVDPFRLLRSAWGL